MAAKDHGIGSGYQPPGGRGERSRGREIDFAVAACAITHGARLWTLNRQDFSDVPGLEICGPR